MEGLTVRIMNMSPIWVKTSRKVILDFFKLKKRRLDRGEGQDGASVRRRKGD